MGHSLAHTHSMSNLNLNFGTYHRTPKSMQNKELHPSDPTISGNEKHAELHKGCFTISVKSNTPFFRHMLKNQAAHLCAEQEMDRFDF